MTEEIADKETNEELDVMSLLVNKDEVTDNDVVEEEEDEVITSDGADYKALYEAERVKVLKRNKSLKISKNSQHRTQEEYDTLLTRVDQLEQSTTANQSDKATDGLAQEDQAWKEKVEDDPSTMPEYMAWRERNFENRLAGFLEKKFGLLESQISETKTASNPELQQYSAQIDTLSQRLPGVTRESLLPLAKELSETKVPRGTIGGHKATNAPSGSDENFVDGLSKKEVVSRFNLGFGEG